MIPYIMIGKPPMNSITSVSVDTDNIQAGYEAVKYLLKKDIKRLVILVRKKMCSILWIDVLAIYKLYPKQAMK